MSNNYGMFTKQGNQRIAAIMVPLKEKPSHDEVVKVIATYLKFAYRRTRKTMLEASDTAVREAVFSDVQDAVGGNWSTADTLWQQAEERVFCRH